MDCLDAECLGRLLDQHGSALVLYARQWCDVPEDVVQDAFVQLARSRQLPENVGGWLYRVVRNGAINAARTAQRRSRRETAVAHRGEPWFHPSPDDRIDAAAATEALAGLPLDQRETIVARLWGGLTFDEIAQVTGATTSTVHRWYQRGLETLRERLGAACPKKKNAQAI